MTDVFAGRVAAEAAALGLLNAAGAKDEAGARELCTEDGWEQGDSPVRGLVRSVIKKGLTLDPMGEPRKLGGRAAQWVVLGHPQRPKPLGDLWLLLEETAEGWRVAGASKLRPVVGLFLWGRVSATLSVPTLDRSPEAEAWAEPVLAALMSGVVPELAQGMALMEQRLAPEGVHVKALRSVSLPAAGRAAAGFRFTTENDRVGYALWFVLDVSDGARILSVVPYLGLEPLLKGFELSWPQEEPEQWGVAQPEQGRDPAGARLVLEQLALRMLAAQGVEPAALQEGSADGQAMGKLFAALRRIAPQEGENEQDERLATAQQRAVAVAAAPSPLVIPPQVHQAVSGVVQQLHERGELQAGEQIVDPEFLKQHGGALVSGVLEALFAESLGEEVTVTVPVDATEAPKDGGEVPSAVTLKLDLAKLLGGLLK